jgi:two-component system LytT family response regulator/two-component system response regulator LytT
MDLRAVLVDDEQLARDELGYLLGQLGGVEVIGQAGNGVEALSTIDRLHPDVVFLDVQMPGLTGFEVARRMLDTQNASHIIFVTAYDQHAIEAFEVNAVDYLLKPVEQARLELAVQRARRRIEIDRMDRAAAVESGATTDPAGLSAQPGAGLTAQSGAGLNAQHGAGLNAQLEKIVRLVTERQARRERLAIKVGERFLLVQADEIIYASLADESIAVVTTQHVGTSNYRTLDELQARLDPDVFWRVHRSHLVNINKIKEIVPWFSRNYILRMKDAKSTEIPVSRTQTRRLREYLKL